MGGMVGGSLPTLRLLKIRYTMKKTIVALTLLSSLPGCMAKNESANLPNTLNTAQADESSAQARGRALRMEIDKIYAEAKLVDMRPADGSKILAKVVERYITAGTRFDYAEALLRSAKIGVDTDPTHVPSRPNEHHGFVQGQLKLQSFWLGGYTAVGIYLYPHREEDFTIIGRVDVNYFSFP
jgi:hypothetical protein